MTENFRYHAYCYLDEWIQFDSVFTEKLSLADDEAAACCLAEIAQYYGVIRNFRDIGEHPRFSKAWAALKQISQPQTIEDAVKQHEELLLLLRADYGKILHSATSKFLWMRFKSPVIIYDQLALGWLCAHAGCKPEWEYGLYCETWLRSYRKYEPEIRIACQGLLSVKSFTLAADWQSEALGNVIDTEWFRQRVFDNFLLFRPGDTRSTSVS